MAKKKAAKKKAVKKKAAKKKAAKKPSATVQLSMPLDAQKVKEIQACLQKGELKLEFARADLGRGRLGSAWLYD